MNFLGPFYTAYDIRHQYSDDGDRLREMLRRSAAETLDCTWRNIVLMLSGVLVLQRISTGRSAGSEILSPVSSLTTIYYCTSVNTMQYNITLEVVVCCVNVFSVKC